MVLRHESTIPAAVNDRIELLEKTQLHVSPTHGLYQDNDFELESYLDESMRKPLYEIEDYQGVREVLSVIHDFNVIGKFIAKLQDQQVILADGHHRLRKLTGVPQAAGSGRSGTYRRRALQLSLMYLTNAASDNLMILPTHRLIREWTTGMTMTYCKNLNPTLPSGPSKTPTMCPKSLPASPGLLACC